MNLKVKKITNKFIIAVISGGVMLSFQACSLKEVKSGANKHPEFTEAKLVPTYRDKKNRYRRDADLVYLLLVAEISAQKGDLQTSVANYLKASLLSEDPKIAERATRVASFARDYKSAMIAAERWALLRPKHLDTYHSLVILYLRNKLIDQAAGAVEEVLKLAKKSKIQGFGHLIALLNNESDKVAVLLLMDKVVAAHSGNAFAHFAYARLALQFKQFGKAKIHAEKTLELKPDYDIAQSLMARIYMMTGKTANALVIMKALIKKHPESLVHRATYARLLAVAKRYDKALIQFKKVLKQKPGNADVVYAIALLTLEQRKLKISEKYFKKLLVMKKRMMESYYYLGSIAENRKQYEKAIGWYIKVKRGENKINAGVRVARLLSKRGKIQSARDYLHSMYRKDKNLTVRLIIVEIDILTNVKDYKAAMQVADKGLKDYEGNSDLLYARSMLAEKDNKLDIAENDLRTILKTEPENIHALNALGYTLADKTTRFKEAMRYIKQAYKLAPEEPAILDSMGWVLYRMGQIDEAIVYLRKAWKLYPDDEIAAHLGEVLWVSGKKKEASKVWKKALKKAPDSIYLKKVLKRFKR